MTEQNPPQQPGWPPQGWQPQGQPQQGWQPQLQPQQPVQYQWQQPQAGFPPPGVPQPPGKQSHRVRNIVIGVVGVLVVLIAIGSALGGGNKPASNASDTSNNTASSAPAGTASQAAGSTDTTTAPPSAPKYTTAQQQAIDSAKNYLSDGTGFSKAGLIHQLDSRYGEGFSKRLALFAVNHVKVNWKHQAVLSARNYMRTEPGWSFNGLVQQLSSSFGEGFTLAQAEYAAHAVGL